MARLAIYTASPSVAISKCNTGEGVKEQTSQRDGKKRCYTFTFTGKCLNYLLASAVLVC